MTSDGKNTTQPLEQWGQETREIELRPGVLLAERYLIERELGHGGIGVTYLARDKHLYSMPVVIKILLDKAQKKEWVKRKFIQEAEALTRISHPGVVKVLNRGEMAGGKPFLDMEFIEGVSLRDVMTPEGMDFEEVAHITQGLGNALHAAHEKGVLHRDIKPENILLQNLDSEGPTVKLIDFGIAKIKDSQIGAATEAGIIAGSIQYIAPEQLTAQPVSTATDVYSVALVLYEMLTGRRPFNPDAPNIVVALQQLLAMQKQGVSILPKQLRPSLPEATQRLLMRALSFEPDSRPQNVRQFCDDIADSLTRHLEGGAFEFPKVSDTKPIDYAKTSAYEEGEDTNPPASASLSKSISDSTTNVSGSLSEKDVVVAKAADTLAEKKESWLRPTTIFLIIALVLVSALAIWNWKTMNPKVEAPTVTEPAKPELKLTYSMTKKVNKESPPALIYETEPLMAGNQVWITVLSPQNAYLYIFNESAEGGSPKFNVLFPSPKTSSGSAKLNAGQRVRLPDNEKGFEIDKKPGTEKIWFVLSVNPIAEFDELAKHWKNEEDRGRIKDDTQANQLREYLYSKAANKLKEDKDGDTKETTLSLHDDVLVKALMFSHF
jgi:serine/threonine protein kinase